MKKIFKNVKKGFTIVELVIVIGVIAILSAILIPTFVGLTGKANNAALQSNLANAYTEYYAEALDDPNLAALERTQVFLSAKPSDESPEEDFYTCSSQGVWSGHTGEDAYVPSAENAEFKSVATSGDARFGGYYIYFEYIPAPAD